MKRILVALALVSIALSAHPADIDEIIVISGRVDNASVELSGLIEVGDLIDAEITVDANTPPISQTDNNAEYIFQGDYGEIELGEFSIPTSAFTLGSINLTNDFTFPNGDPGGDQVSFGFTNGTFDVGGFFIESIGFGFDDPTGAAIDSVDLDSLVGAIASDFSSNANFTVFFRPILPIQQAANGIIIASGPITGLSVTTSAVPIPAALWLFGSGLIGLFAWKGRRQ